MVKRKIKVLSLKVKRQLPVLRNEEIVGGIYMVGRIYHVGLTVSDLDRSIAFYFRDPDGIILEMMQPL